MKQLFECLGELARTFFLFDFYIYKSYLLSVKIYTTCYD